MAKRPVAPLLWMLVTGMLPWAGEDEPTYEDAAQTFPMGNIIGIILGAVVLVLVIFIYADFAEPIMNATENFTLALTGGSTGVALIDNLLPTLAILIAAAVPLGLIGAVLVAINRNL